MSFFFTGKRVANEQLSILKDEIAVIMKGQDLQKISDLCLSKFNITDQTKSGIIKVADFRRVLLNITSTGNGTLSDLEVVKICHDLPRDSFGRSLYATFSTVLENVRFNSLKHELLELRGTYLQKALIEECKKMEEICYLTQSLKNISASKFNHTGVLTFRDMLYVLNNSTLLATLSKLQVIILMSEANMLPGNKIDYYLFIPVVATAVEVLSEDENFRQRVEIARTADIFFDINDVAKVRKQIHIILCRLSVVIDLLSFIVIAIIVCLLLIFFLSSDIFFDINDVAKAKKYDITLFCLYCCSFFRGFSY